MSGCRMIPLSADAGRLKLPRIVSRFRRLFGIWFRAGMLALVVASPASQV